MERADLDKILYPFIDQAGGRITGLGQAIYETPETGFKEYRTARIVLEAFAGLPLQSWSCADFPAMKFTLDTGRPGPGVAILGELDAVTCPRHPDSAPDTGAVHACGHNIQTAALYGAAIGLLAGGAAGRLCGKIHFMAVPAEEFIEIAYRKELIRQGRIRFLGGKAELLARGLFDDVDIALMMHVAPDVKKIAFQSANGCIVKTVRFTGRAAHAGAAPHDGVNALYAATAALAAVNSLRETFRERDCIRIHPIITKGGTIVNVIPDDVQLETFVRGNRFEAILDAARKFDRAMAGSALALGAAVEIEDMPGAFPYYYDEGLKSAVLQAVGHLVRQDEIADLGHMTGSTDIGDLSMIMPVIQPFIGGVSGGLHEEDYRISDPDTAYLLSAKLLAGTAAVLLSDEAAAARQILKRYKPVFSSRAALIRQLDSLYAVRAFSGEDPRLADIWRTR